VLGPKPVDALLSEASVAPADGAPAGMWQRRLSVIHDLRAASLCRPPRSKSRGRSIWPRLICKRAWCALVPNHQHVPYRVSMGVPAVTKR
jgi:hypothetical protein